MSDGVLVRAGPGSVEFFHQAYFELVAGLVTASADVVDFARKEGLRLSFRPIIASALEWLRDDPAKLKRAVRELLADPTPYHLRFLAIGLLQGGDIPPDIVTDLFDRAVMNDSRLLEWFLVGLSPEQAMNFLERLDAEPDRLDDRGVRWQYADALARVAGSPRAQDAVPLLDRSIRRELDRSELDVHYLGELLRLAGNVAGDERIVAVIARAASSDSCRVRRYAYKVAARIEPPEEAQDSRDRVHSRSRGPCGR